MKMRFDKRIGILMVSMLAVLSFYNGVRLLQAGDNIVFPNCLKEKRDSIEQCAYHVFQIVAKKMGIEIIDTVPKPIILTDEQITLSQYNRYLGWNSVKVLPYYFYKQNTIVIPNHCGLDSLAHELVHYFQFIYRQDNFDCDYGFYTEGLEMEAVAIERWFESKHLRFQDFVASLP